MRALLIACLVAACGSEPAGPRNKLFGGDRPAELKTPEMLTEGKEYPLVVILHGYSANGFAQTAYFSAGALATNDQALVIAPDGTVDASGKQFWNADAACCDFGGLAPDDVGYIGGLIDDIKAEWPVDKVYLIGHSNGGFMAYRMACERADVVTAIASLAGNASSTPSECTPTEPVSVLHLHGTEDATVPFTGGSLGIGAPGSVSQWAMHNGCGTTRSPTVTLDLDTVVAGSETTGETTANCPPRVVVELWSMTGSGHIPVFAQTISTTLLEWFIVNGGD